MNDELWTNVSKYDDDDWLLSPSLLLPQSYICVRLGIRMTNHRMSKSICSNFFYWHFNKLNPPMYELNIFDTFWYTSVYFITVCKIGILYILYNNSWNSNLVRNKTHNTNEMYFFFICFFFLLLIFTLYIVLIIYQCNMILLWINNNFICCIYLVPVYILLPHRYCSHLSLHSFFFFFCSARKNDMWIYCIKLQKYLRYNCC